MPELRITSFGAVPDGTTDNAKAIQKAIDSCHASGGGRIVIPGPGTFLSGGLVLRSGIDLHLELGAVLLASPRFEDHREIGPLSGNFNSASVARPEGTKIARCFLQACGANDLVFSGHGVIDGNARAYREADLGPIYRMKPDRPRLIFLENCHRIHARELTIRDGAAWTFHPVGCKDVLIDGIRILNDLKTPNCDGIDPDHCRYVRIANCHIEAGDDAIVLKNHSSYAGYGDCANIAITNCSLVSTSAAIKIGTESHGNFHSIVVSNCVIDRSNRGLSIQLRDWGSVENVLFQNITIRTRLFAPLWWGRAEPIAITAFPRRPGDRLGSIRGVHFSHIRARGEGGVLVAADGEGTISGVVFDHVAIHLEKTTGHAAGWKDLRPLQGEEHGGCEPHPLYGFLLENADQIHLRNCDVQWGNYEYDPGFRPPEAWSHEAIHAHKVRGLVTENLRTTGIQKGPVS